MNKTYEEKFIVRTWDVDKANRLKMSTMYNYCQDVAGNHAAAQGIGRDYMTARGLVWILCRMSAVLTCRPPRSSELIMRTWSCGTDTLFTMRDYELLNADGSRAGLGRAAWIIAEIASMRPRRPEAFMKDIPFLRQAPLVPDGAAPVPPVPDTALHETRSRAVNYSDVDYNGHMNNARYVDWVQDCMDTDELSSAAAMRLDVQYAAEIKAGQSALLYKARTESAAPWTSAYILEGRTPEGISSFRARLSL